MNDQILDELRSSLSEIKALAAKAVALNSESFTSEQEQELKESLSKSRGGSFVTPQPAEALALKQKLMSGLNADREVFDIVHAINVLAMANADVIHIWAEYAPSINEFSAYVKSANTNYKSLAKSPRLMCEWVSLSDENALEKLLTIETKVTELVIEAREEAETNVEVEA
ncbi:hypothetical protein [Vibrio splendidus]|uniref:hypothetical protein n=1 Tax=Vibrio splendidus TaxID=29497 RepID=UPI000C861391|nr:hypothetical protein [Vibrio splendidus]PMN25940.1 hypothetical protein BCT36_11340 [Vibrio splendidus]